MAKQNGKYFDFFVKNKIWTIWIRNSVKRKT